jgi:predicted ATP-grasp superfamily ATP-dependent carboligase
VLIAAASGRALAAAARRAGYAPLVADRFGDDDTAALAAAHAVVPARGGWLTALAGLAAGRAPLGLVYGGGFDRRPGLLRAFARRHGLLGNDPATVARVKDPFAFAALCRALEVPHPEIARAPGAGDWLEKRAGGGGGAHIRAARGPARRGRYLQRRVAGRPVSALLLADGAAARVLGLSEQWAAPAPGAPFRYGGAVRPAGVPEGQAAAMAAAAARVAAASGLVGLNSADFLLGEDGFVLLELNPRPGASLDVFAPLDPFALHLAACRGRLPDALPPLAGAAAAGIVYARRRLRMPDGFAWPDWAADRQRGGTEVPAGAPLCTVCAAAGTAAGARALVAERAAGILALAEEGGGA